MNDIIFAGNAADMPAEIQRRQLNFLRVWISGKSGEALVAPPLATFEGAPAGGDMLVCIEQPLLPHSPAFTVCDGRGGLRHAAEQAVYYFEKSAAISGALGELIVAYIADASPAKGQPAVEKLKAEIEKNLSDPTYSVETSIRKLPLNYDYVRKLFKRQTGLTPLEYLTGKRMALARSIISGGISNSYSSYTVSQIAEACGYAEPLYFSKVFKQHFGLSPLAFARQCRQPSDGQ